MLSRLTPLASLLGLTITFRLVLLLLREWVGVLLAELPSIPFNTGCNFPPCTELELSFSGIKNIQDEWMGCIMIKRVCYMKTTKCRSACTMVQSAPLDSIIILDGVCINQTAKALLNEPPHDKANKMTCAPNEDRSAWASAQMQLRTQGFFTETAKTLIRLGWYPGWSKSNCLR